MCCNLERYREDGHGPCARMTPTKKHKQGQTRFQAISESSKQEETIENNKTHNRGVVLEAVRQDGWPCSTRTRTLGPRGRPRGRPRGPWALAGRGWRRGMSATHVWSVSWSDAFKAEIHRIATTSAKSNEILSFAHQPWNYTKKAGMVLP